MRIVPSCKLLSVMGGALLATVVSATLSAQLSWGGEPVSRHVLLRSVVPTVVMEQVDVAQYLAEDLVAPKNTPFRFGATLPVDLGLDNAGVWDTLANGDRVWRLRISSPGAYSLSAIFSRYVVPGGSSLFVYNDQQGTLGSYDDRNVKDDHEFAFEPLSGDAMTLEYYEPAAVAGQGQIHLRSVIHDYRDINTLLKNGGAGDASGACEVDVNCPIGAPWVNQRNAVTVLFIGGGACSGSLINNANNDGTQYYMSAYHCGSLNNAIFRFNYEKSGCGSGTAPTNHTVQGSIELAANQTDDYRFVKVTSAIPAAYTPYYLGWDHSATAIPTNVLGIHHPQVDVKKISFSNAAPAHQGVFWHIAQWNVGATEPGSSGSPLMNQLGRFIGQLYGGSSSCSFQFDDVYGRFDLAWPAVKTYLDPANTGVVAIDGFDPNVSASPPVLASVAPGSVQALLGGTMTLTGSHFLSANKVTVGSVQLLTPGTDFIIVNDTTITFPAPQAAALGTTNVTVSNSAGTSAPKTFTYTECNPPVLSASVLALNGQPYTWTWGCSSNGISYLIYSLSNTTFTYSGYPILLNLGILNVSSLGPTGLGTLTITIPAGTQGLFFYSEVVGFTGGGAFVGASPVVSSLIF